MRVARRSTHEREGFAVGPEERNIRLRAAPVDGGGSKTDVALVRADGEALALVRGPSSHSHHLGVEGSLDVIEVPARVSRMGATPLPQPPVAPELLGLIQHVTAYEQLALEAAVTGDPVVVRKALLAHPLVGQETLADELTDRLLEAGAKHLPQFPAREGVA
jgi:hypothetical protein